VIQPDTSLDYNIYYVNIMKGDSCYRDSIRIKIIDCPCGGDPVATPQISPTDLAGTNLAGGLFGCVREDPAFACCLTTNLSCMTNCCIDSTTYLTIKNKKHNGLDILAPVGTYIHSMTPGIVTVPSFSSSLGNSVYVEHGGINYRYNHMDEIFVKSNDRIKVGQVLGTAGRSGNAANVPHAHLHLVVHNGVAGVPSNRVDPRPFLTTKFDSTTLNYIQNNCN